MTRSLRLLFVLALTLGGSALLAACDVGTVARDPDTLLLDARLARQGGDLEEAIALLEEAYALDPTLADVRVELASAYLQHDDIDLLDVDRLMLFVAGTAPASPRPEGGPPSGRVGGACVYESDPAATPFALGGVEGYAALFEHEDVVASANALLHDAPAGAPAVMPAALRAIALCGAVVDGRLEYDREAALAALRATGLTDDEIAAALAVNGATRFLDSYFFLAEDLPQQTAWYRLGDGAIGVCTDDPTALVLQSTGALTDMFEALASFDLRDRILGGTVASRELVDHGVTAFEAILGTLGPVCGGS